MKLTLRFAAAFALLIAVAGLLQVSGSTRLAHQQERVSTIQPDVTDALQRDSSVGVIIHLKSDRGSEARLDAAGRSADRARRQENVIRALERSGFSLTHRYKNAPAVAGRITSADLDSLRDHPDVLTVSLDAPISAALGESVPLIGVDHSELGPAFVNGSGMTVAVIDTGIDTDHPDLADSIVGQECFITWSGVCPDDPAHPLYDPNNPAEDDMFLSHGTHVSGIITANGVIVPKGVAPEADIYAYKILNWFGDGHFSDLLSALDDIYEKDQVDFINMSLANSVVYPAGTCQGEDPDNPGLFPALTETLAALRDDNGVLAFAASGNNGSKLGISYPACEASVVSVGAVYDADVGSFGCDATTEADQVACFSQSSDDLDLLAPGATILSASRDADLQAVLSGTSMASPHAAGLAALIKQITPSMTPDDIEQFLKSTGVPVTDDFDPANIKTTPRIDANALPIPGDDDGDGCSNLRELQTAPGSEVTGGLRDPLNPWDFYDVAGPGGVPVPDGVIDLPNDILGVIQHYSPSGAPPYDVQYDRGPSTGPNTWNMTAPDGKIDLFNDINGVIGQYDHDCT